MARMACRRFESGLIDTQLNSVPGESEALPSPPKAQPPRKRSGQRTGTGATRWKEAGESRSLAEGASEPDGSRNLSGAETAGAAYNLKPEVRAVDSKGAAYG